MAPLREAEQIFYQAGLRPAQAIEAVSALLDRLQEFARYVIAHIYASVLSNRDVLVNAPFIANLDIANTVFDPGQMALLYSNYSGASQIYSWNLNPYVLERFIPASNTMELGV
jgi:hypothetical protein